MFIQNAYSYTFFDDILIIIHSAEVLFLGLAVGVGFEPTILQGNSLMRLPIPPPHIVSHCANQPSYSYSTANSRKEVKGEEISQLCFYTILTKFVI